MTPEKSLEEVLAIEMQMLLDGIFLSLELYGNDRIANASIFRYVMRRIMGVIHGRNQEQERELPLPPIPDGTSRQFFEDIVLTRVKHYVKEQDDQSEVTIKILYKLYDMCSEKGLLSRAEIQAMRAAE